MSQSKLVRRVAAIVVCFSLFAATSSAKADQLATDAKVVVIGIALVGVAIGFGIYAAIHASHSVEGCAVAGPGGIELRQNDGKQTWMLLGDTSSIKPGHRIRVSGKRKKKRGEGPREFIVENPGKDKGPCS